MQGEINSNSSLAEVHFYMLLDIENSARPVAVASFYGRPHEALFRQSSKTYVTVQHFRDVDIRVIDAKSIKSVVMMAPDERYKTRFEDGTQDSRWFLMERPRLKLSEMLDQDLGEDSDE